MFDFKDFTGKEKKTIAERERDIEIASKETQDRLRECIGSDTFKKYREELEKSGNALIAVGVDILKTVKKPEERLSLYDALFVRADVLSLLFKGITKDSI